MAEEEDKSEEKGDGAAKQEKKPKNPGQLLVMLFMVLDFAVMGGGAFWVYTSTLGYTPNKATEEEELEALIKERENRASEAVVYTMDRMSVNLMGTPQRTIKIELNLEMLDEQGFEEVVSLGAEARDSIVKLLNGKRFTDLESIQGKLFLKDQIAMTLNQFLDKGVVKDVYFTEFLVQ